MSDLKALRAGVIGLGAMGAPMARHIGEAGFLEAVWNRTESSAHQLAGVLNVPVAENPAVLASRCNVILICVSADEDLRSVVEQLAPGLRARSIILDTSTVSPTTTQELAKKLATQDVRWVDAPVSGGVEGARNGQLSAMVGGESADISRIRPILDAFSARVTHMGPVGSGQATKAVNQVLVGGIAEAVCEALAFSEKLNLPSERLIEVLSAGAAGNWFLDHRGRTMLEDQFEPGFKSNLLLKDLRICHELARELNFYLPMTQATIRDYDSLVEGGGGEHDTSALIRLKRDPNQTRD